MEFAFPEVAQIAAESMNNYLMCNKLLKCKEKPLVGQEISCIFKPPPQSVIVMLSCRSRCGTGEGGEKDVDARQKSSIKRKNSERGTENSQQSTLRE